MTREPGRTEDEHGFYDLRRGAEGYAPIVGSVGGFVVTAVVVVFTVADRLGSTDPALMTLVTGLLVLSLIGCLLGSFALAAIGAETVFTPNLPAAGMYIGAGVGLSVFAILAAFEGLASFYLPDSTILFAGITASGAIAASVFNAATVLDSWAGDARSVPWISSRRHANMWVARLCLLVICPVALAFVLYVVDARITWGVTATNYVIGLGIVVVVGAELAGVLRTIHTKAPYARCIKRWEAIAIQVATAVYVSLVVISLP